ncbi:MAG: phage tail protein I [Mariprofundaceae bacterium]|nr:phage tail protein I [Mariprofundaceae bacterium]
MADVTTILPPNATDLERNIEQSATRAIEQLPVPIRDLWNPDLCPLALLPWLAWAVDVEQWQSDWPESVQRAAIKASIPVHNKMGTARSVRQALAALGASVTLTEWHQNNGAPHTFDLTAWANENLAPAGKPILDTALYDALIAAVTETKPARSHFTFRVGARFTNGVTMGATMSGSALTRRSATTYRPPIAAQGGITSAVTASIAAVARFPMEAI